VKWGNRPEGPRGGKRGAGNTELLEGKMSGTQCPESVSTKLRRIAKLASREPKLALTTLAHHIDIEWMREAYRRTRKDGAVGVDGQTAEEYAARLDENLASLLKRAKEGRYRAPPVRRVHIPKDNGSTRPIGIPTFEDKVLQRAVAMVLEAVYEQDFLDCSYGFRPGRSQHQALDRVWQGMMTMGGGWVLEVDIRSFFDTLDHAHLQEILRHRVRDGVIVRLVGKWLNAGILEHGCVTHPEEGTPQGGVISPMLANIYLHEVLDGWFEEEVKPRLRGQAFMVRFADDAVLGFASEQDARRVMEVLPKRFSRFGLTLHPEKTRLVPFQRPTDKGPEPGSFDLLGFRHYWDKSRGGSWVIKRKTASNRLSRAIQRVTAWCRSHRHDPIGEQHEMLVRKLRGHYGYYGITGNFRALALFLEAVRASWRKWLCRRSQRGRLTWQRFGALVRSVYPLPQPRIVHSVYRAAKP
jgi:group II intron reverse transcriptase/maturase